MAEATGLNTPPPPEPSQPVDHLCAKFHRDGLDFYREHTHIYTNIALYLVEDFELHQKTLKYVSFSVSKEFTLKMDLDRSDWGVPDFPISVPQLENPSTHREAVNNSMARLHLNCFVL